MSKFTNFSDSGFHFSFDFSFCYLSTIRPITESNAPISPGSHSLRRDFFSHRGFPIPLPLLQPGHAFPYKAHTLLPTTLSPNLRP